jgi:hypothetical protein
MDTLWLLIHGDDSFDAGFSASSNTWGKRFEKCSTPSAGWKTARTGLTEDETFSQTGQQFQFVSNQDGEAQICLQDAVNLHKPPSDIRFTLAQMVCD